MHFQSKENTFSQSKPVFTDNKKARTKTLSAFPGIAKHHATKQVKAHAESVSINFHFLVASLLIGDFGKARTEVNASLS